MTTTDPAAAERLAIATDGDVVRVRQAVRALAQGARLSLVDQTKLVTAASELARNTLIYGGGGEALLSVETNGRRTGVRVEFRDEGPGIPDLDQAMTDGWTSGSGLGLGLSGARRLVEQFAIDTAPGRGTRVTITSWSR
ncbi:anti-sigma regulatory factor [Cellulomonas hominis]|uniref:Anti-sigma regulatory factor n=1 Tax=Cellulomonas hominis TaxID=156981 RepID=A0A511FCZ4_9CELL|nr:anti-sigma regulatory factor [Cellulomonas hominis]MBB5475220.1 serine/threonine-protein kinase RsbT [Cellulomonas hominis]NKY07735.1 anti-sigma regulatory factor [Cellulomonas hominis]NKY09213.1 anti-sigma regulatory factor [Cellulomonas hominis]GEL47129.1 anti-sigma regulatory factor [Cellulomonas hominis]